MSIGLSLSLCLSLCLSLSLSVSLPLMSFSLYCLLFHNMLLTFVLCCTVTHVYAPRIWESFPSVHYKVICGLRWAVLLPIKQHIYIFLYIWSKMQERAGVFTEVSYRSLLSHPWCPWLQSLLPPYLLTLSLFPLALLAPYFYFTATSPPFLPVCISVCTWACICVWSDYFLNIKDLNIVLCGVFIFSYFLFYFWYAVIHYFVMVLLCALLIGIILGLCGCACEYARPPHRTALN